MGGVGDRGKISYKCFLFSAKVFAAFCSICSHGSAYMLTIRRDAKSGTQVFSQRSVAIARETVHQVTLKTSGPSGVDSHVFP